MIINLKKTSAVINGYLILISIITFSVNANANAMLSGSVTIRAISKLLKKMKTPNHNVDYKYPSEVEEYQFTMRVSDPKDCNFEKYINK